MIIAVLFIFLSFVKEARAFGFDFTYDIMGVTCGIAADPTKNKCCRAPNAELDLTTGDAIIDNPLTPIRAPLEWLFNGVAQSLPLKVQQYTQKLSKENLWSSCYIDSIPSTLDLTDPNCLCIASASSVLTSAIDLCEPISKPSEKNECLSCVQSPDGGIWTSVGCVYSDVRTFIEKTLLGWGIGLAGIMALLCIIYSSFLMQTSQGNPEKIKKAQELLTSCIMGLMLIIFSVFILRLIGVNILRIPGFS